MVALTKVRHSADSVVSVERHATDSLLRGGLGSARAAATAAATPPPPPNAQGEAQHDEEAEGEHGETVVHRIRAHARRLGERGGDGRRQAVLAGERGFHGDGVGGRKVVQCGGDRRRARRPSAHPALRHMPPRPPPEAATRAQRRLRAFTAATVAALAGGLLLQDWGPGTVLSPVRPAVKKALNAAYGVKEVEKEREQR